jgi:TP901-1 family phage major tail protein
MAGQKGRDILLKIGDGGAPEVFTTVAGIRARTVSLNAQMVDATSADSPGAWRELIAGAGVKAALVRGAGVFKDAQSDGLVRASFFAQTACAWMLVIPDFGVIEGPFLIEALDYAGEEDGEAGFSIALASAGALSFTPA